MISLTPLGDPDAVVCVDGVCALPGMTTPDPDRSDNAGQSQPDEAGPDLGADGPAATHSQRPSTPAIQQPEATANPTT